MNQLNFTKEIYRKKNSFQQILIQIHNRFLIQSCRNFVSYEGDYTIWLQTMLHGLLLN